MSWQANPTTADRNKAQVTRLLRMCTDGEMTFKAAARSHAPVVVLLAYMAREVISQTELARRLGIRQPDVSRLLDGKSVPDSHLRLRIEAVCSIPVESWDKAWKAA